MPDERTVGGRSGCPIATTLDIVGDRWTLVLIRDMLTGKERYGQFLESPEGIPTNILASRLRMLESTGMVKKEAYQERPIRYGYVLTEKGRAMLPVLQEVCRWANRYYPETWKAPDTFMEPYVPAT